MGDCWICLEPCLERQQCSCKQRFVHERCLAKWQFQSVGKTEEKKCRFCDTVLPDWRYVLTPDYDDYLFPMTFTCIVGNQTADIKISPYMTKEEFKNELEDVLCIDITHSRLTFNCDDPFNNKKTINLDGIQAFDAVMYCARTMGSPHIAQRSPSREPIENRTLIKRIKQALCLAVKNVII